MQRHLAVDIGSESGRAFAGHIENGRLCAEEIHRFRTQFMQLGDRSIRNFYRYHEEILEALRLYAVKYGPDLASVGVDAWGGDFVLLNRAGDVLRLPSSYRANALASDAAAVAEDKFGAWNIYRRNGNQSMPTDTLHQLIRLRAANDPSLDDPRAILFVADLFHYFLGAEPACEHSLASYCRVYNAARDDWDEEILRAFGIPPAIRTKIVRAGDVIGRVNGKILRQAGLDEGVPIVTPCSHDTACAALAVPDEGDDWAFISSGTWSLMGVETAAPVLGELAFRSNFSNSTMPLMTNMFKKNITGTWIIQQCAKAWARYGYDEIVSLAEAAADEDLFIDIDATDFYAPEDMPAAVSAFVARNFGRNVAPDDAGAIARIVFQSMALKYRYYLEKLLEASGRRISKIYILGGGSKNRLINRFTAAATGYSVFTGVYEASSTGNLLLQAYGCGELKDKAQMRRVVKDSFPLNEFSPDGAAAWDRKYKAYLKHAAKRNEW